MTTAFTATFDPRDLVEIDQYLSAANQRSIKRRVINRSASRTRKATMAEIAHVTTLKKSRIRKGFSPVRRASSQNLVATVKISGKRITVHSFKGKPTKPRHEYARVYSKATKDKTALTKRPYSYEINRGEKKTTRYIFLQRVRSPQGSENLLPLAQLDSGGRRVNVESGPSLPGLWQGDRYNDIRENITKDQRRLLVEDMRAEVAKAITKKRTARPRGPARKA